VEGKSAIRPRVVPTVIAFLDGVPALGWEGFAAMAPDEIQDAMVLDVLRQAAALSNASEGQTSPDTDATMEAGADAHDLDPR
jgi:thioredoxin-like negative regulator of GroEL